MAKAGRHAERTDQQRTQGTVVGLAVSILLTVIPGTLDLRSSGSAFGYLHGDLSRLTEVSERATAGEVDRAGTVINGDSPAARARYASRSRALPRARAGFGWPQTQHSRWGRSGTGRSGPRRVGHHAEHDAQPASRRRLPRARHPRRGGRGHWRGQERPEPVVHVTAPGLRLARAAQQLPVRSLRAGLDAVVGSARAIGSQPFRRSPQRIGRPRG